MARLPNYEKTFIDPNKIRDYILSTSHPVGRFKAALFERMGYTKENREQLINDIKLYHLPLDAEVLEKNQYGQKYIIKGVIKWPNGKMIMFKSIWIILEGEDIPRFITIYPEGGGYEI